MEPESSLPCSQGPDISEIITEVEGLTGVFDFSFVVSYSQQMITPYK